MPHNLHAIACALGLSLPAGTPDITIDALLTDSRSLRRPGGTLFFALRSASGDGHRYIPFLYRKGVRAFAVETIPEHVAEMPEAVWLTVPDTLQALRIVGSLGRGNAREIVAVTGSRGKTSLKEWLFRILSPHMRVSRSPRSFNSQIGVPLSMWEIAAGTDIAVIEAGISQPGEMLHLRDCIRPHCVIITNIDSDHQENFNSYRQKACEKMMLAAGADTRLLVMPGHDRELAGAYAALRPDVSVALWDIDRERDYAWDSLLTPKTDAGHLRVKASEDTGCCSYVWTGPDGIRSEGDFRLASYSPPELANACSALAFMLASGRGEAVFKEHAPSLRHIDTRLSVKEGINGCTLITDSYTNDYPSLVPALDFMHRRRTPGQTLTLVVSDFVHDDASASSPYSCLASLLGEFGVQRLIGVGPRMVANRSIFPPDARIYPDTAAMLADLSTSDFDQETVLIKGSPEFKLESLTQRLEYKTHETVLEVNLDSLIKNYNYFRSKTSPSTGIVCMVKASGYGAGSREIAKTLQDCGAAYLAVAVLDEGIDLRREGITCPIMVMNPRVVNYRSMFTHRLEPEIYSFDMLADVIREAGKHGMHRYPIHIKLDTGMHRMGFTCDEMPRLAHILNDQDVVRMETVFSHLATADCLDMDSYTLRQIRIFEEATAYLRSHLHTPFKRHILNSAGILRFPQADYDLVRLGIGLYGVNTLPPEIEAPLAPVSALRTIVIALRHYKKGEAIGYGRRTVLQRDSTIATLPIGYADGMNRHFGRGNLKVAVNGCLAPTAGNICMDACMIDVTGIECRVGDPVEIFGAQLPVSRMADLLDTIPYEILTSVSPRVKRIYYRE